MAYKEVDRQTFTDDKTRGDEWIEGTAETAARNYADAMRRTALRYNKGKDFATHAERIGRHDWAAILYEVT